ncbi:MAG: hypothetical protein DMF52_02970 [Acidobacteria bacterium]|nr:MAG: hypothetical protein DMF52_02970 [Acidobacteriota bacterium]
MPGILGGRLLARVAADYTRYREEFDDPTGPTSVTGRLVDTVNLIDTLGAEFGLVVAAPGRQAISFLLARRRETADLEDRAIRGPADIGRAMRHGTVVTLEDQISFASDRLVINPSLRHEAYASTFRPGSAGGVVLPDEEDSYLTGKIGFRLKASEALTVKGNFGRFARLPDFVELFGNQGSVQGNPALMPERGRSLDLGLAASLPRPAGALRSARVEFTLFETLAEDLIQFIPNSQSTVLAQNFDRARIRGAELTLALGIGKRFNGSLNVTHQAPRDVSGRPTDGRLLPGRPQNEMTASATLAAGPGRLFYDFTYVGRNFIDPSNTPSEALPARYLHDAGYRLRLRKGLDATFEVNVGDLPGHRDRRLRTHLSRHRSRPRDDLRRGIARRRRPGVRGAGARPLGQRRRRPAGVRGAAGDRSARLVRQRRSGDRILRTDPRRKRRPPARSRRDGSGWRPAGGRARGALRIPWTRLVRGGETATVSRRGLRPAGVDRQGLRHHGALRHADQRGGRRRDHQQRRDRAGRGRKAVHCEPIHVRQRAGAQSGRSVRDALRVLDRQPVEPSRSRCPAARGRRRRGHRIHHALRRRVQRRRGHGPRDGRHRGSHRPHAVRPQPRPLSPARSGASARRPDLRHAAGRGRLLQRINERTGRGHRSGAPAGDPGHRPLRPESLRVAVLRARDRSHLRRAGRPLPRLQPAGAGPERRHRNDRPGHPRRPRAPGGR